MKVIIVGAGPAGLLCAYQECLKQNNHFILIDSNEKIGKKLFITGKGRCNITNNVNNQQFLSNIVNNEKFLYSAINSFNANDTMNFFNENGVKLKIERGNRVFPLSDKSSDVLKCFMNLIKKNKIELRLNFLVLDIIKRENGFEVISNTESIYSDIVVIATGGNSYCSTGSNGDGYRFAKKLGHNIVNIKPALVPILLKDYDGSLAGLSLKNVKLSFKVNNKIFTEFGEMIFTHSGISGPIVLSLSSYINKFNLENKIISIDLKPALSSKQIDDRLVRDWTKNKVLLKNYLKELLPSSLINFFMLKGELKNQEVCNINKETRQNIISLLKCFEFKIDGLDDIKYAIITSGGVDTRQINPKTMESKVVNGLFFVGEIIDVDALTGGFNIQIALSTGYTAGKYINFLGG